MNKKLFISALAVVITALSYNACYAEDAAVQEASAVKTLPNHERTMPDRPQGPPPAEFRHHNGGPQHFGAPPSKEEMAAKKAEIDKRLKLTDAQKKQIEEQKIQDREKIKPVFDTLKLKKQEIQKINADTTLSQEDKAEKTNQLRKDIRDLKGQIRSAHEENMKNFESVLTEKQKKEFAKIKAEQKKEMEKRKKSFEQNKKDRPEYGLPVQPKPKQVEE